MRVRGRVCLHHPRRAVGRGGSIQPTQEIHSAPNIRVISTDALIGEAINRTAAEQSVSSLFD
jgi:phosphoribosylpyrophosphate synthetase